jgi:hypothetical protein
MPVKGKNTADVSKITNHMLHPVMPQATCHVGTATREPTTDPDEQIMGERPQEHEEPLGLEALRGSRLVMPKPLLSWPKLDSMPPR